MAFDWSKLNFFSRLNARSRILVLLAVIMGTILLIYLLVRVFFGGSATTGASNVANVPSGYTSVPGAKTITPEYAKAMEQARNIAAQQAQISGTSAVPTMQYMPQQNQSGNCTVICAEQVPTINADIDDWVKQGKLSSDVGSSLEQLGANNVPVDDFAAEIDKLVRAGKLTPEQARKLLETYKRQHSNALLQDSANLMDSMIKSGQLPTNVANQLLNLQKNGISPSNYAAEIERLVADGKLTPATAARLLAQYTQQCVSESVKENNTFIKQMSSNGEITPQIAADLTALTNKGAAINDYSNALKTNVTQGKITPAAAIKLMDKYNKLKSSCGSVALINQLVQQAEAAAYKEISDLLNAGKIGQDVATSLGNMIKNDVSLDEFQKTVGNFVQQGKMTPEIAKLKIADYQKVKGLREEAKRLAALQANNATAANYTEELKRAVQAGLISPDDAARLLQEYQASTMRAAPVATGGTPQDQAVARLQASLQQNAAGNVPTAAQFATVQTQAVTETEQDKLARIQAIMQAMSNQAGQLVNSWQVQQQVVRQGSPQVPKVVTATTTTTTTGGGPPGGPPSSEMIGGTPALIKGGTILFAVLDSAVNSDYPDSPVLATIVDGKFKGAKLLGKLVTTKGVTGQMDRVALNFTVMNMDEWPKSKSINAFAIDPDTARTVMASSVDYHYLQRYGAIFATSFLQGYGNAILTSGSTQTTGIFGTSSVHPNLSPGQKIGAALGQVGQTLGQATANYINRPPTVRVDSGVGLGILFMSDINT